MYGLDPHWDPYFDTLEPEERLTLLDWLPDRDDEVKVFCQTLYRERYTHPKQPDRKADSWLWKIVYLPGLYKRRRIFGKGPLQKEMEGTLKELHLEDSGSLSETEQTILYLEFRNTARRYLSTCRGVNYASRLLGLKKATEQEKLDRACEDIWMASRGLARTAGLEENLKLWCNALYDELLDYDPDGGKHYTELEENFKK